MAKTVLFCLVIFNLVFSKEIATFNVENLTQTTSITGPWQYAIGKFDTLEEKYFANNQVILPHFFDETLNFHKGIITLAITLQTTPYQPLSLYMGKPYSAWVLYVNGKYIGHSGTVGKNDEEHQGDTKNPTVTFIPTSKTTSIIVHIANTHHRHIGLTNPPSISPKGLLEAEKRHRSYAELVVTTVFFSFALYHFGLYLAWRRDKSPLWFGLLAFSLAVRSSTTGEVMILEFFPHLSWELLLRIEYFSVFFSFLFLFTLSQTIPKIGQIFLYSRKSLFSF